MAAFALAAPAWGAKPSPLSAADRHAINRTLDVFVPAAAARKDPAAAYALATANLRAGTSRAAWARGDLPVYPYRPGEQRFHDWTVSYREGNLVGLDLMLQPGKRESSGPIIFAVDVKRVGARWLVDGFNPEAIFARTGERAKLFAARDVAAPAGGAQAADKARIGGVWFAVPLAVLGLGLAVPVGFLLLNWRRDRRAAREYRRSLSSRA